MFERYGIPIIALSLIKVLILLFSLLKTDDLAKGENTTGIDFRK